MLNVLEWSLPKRFGHESRLPDVVVLVEVEDHVDHVLGIREVQCPTPVSVSTIVIGVS
jgi:hypothetical protein